MTKAQRYILDNNKALLKQLELILKGEGTVAIANKCDVNKAHITRLKRTHKEFITANIQENK